MVVTSFCHRSSPILSGSHSTGRGGAANVTYAPSPGFEILPHHEGAAFHSSGHGGAGNIRAR